MKTFAYGLTAAFVSCLLTSAPACAEKNVILARTSPDVVLVWKVNDVMGTLATGHVTPAALQRALLTRGIDVMLRALPLDAAASETVTAKLVYFSNGGYDPNYKIETVSGVRRVGEISAAAGSLRREAPAWKAQLERGRLPSALHAQFADDAFTGLGP